MIELTSDAIAAARRLQSDNAAYQGLPLRLYIEGKGCDGFSYGVAFAKKDEDDLEFDQGDISLIIDPETHRYLDGASIEWVDDDRGSGFLVNNPNHRKFRGKFFKRKNWQERLLSSTPRDPSIQK